jgi:hypothetical protein
MEKLVSIHPVLMMIGILGGISIMGIIGLILGPLFIAHLVSSYQILIDQLNMVKTKGVNRHLFEFFFFMHVNTMTEGMGGTGLTTREAYARKSR